MESHWGRVMEVRQHRPAPTECRRGKKKKKKEKRKKKKFSMECVLAMASTQ